jgi:hypothetical protein
LYEWALKKQGKASDFQAEYEDSISSTRSNFSRRDQKPAKAPVFEAPIFPDTDCGDVSSGEKPDDRERQWESDTQRSADNQRNRQKPT